MLLELDHDWIPVNPFSSFATAESFLTVGSAGRRVHVVYAKRKSDDVLVGKVWFGRDAQGPPGHVHGGALAAVLDEAMSAAAWHAGHAIVVARLTVDFREMVPLEREAWFEAHVSGVDGRKVSTRATLYVDRTVVASSDGLCVMLSPEARAAFERRATS